MPSPFPGMDPYLEDPGLWPDVHSRLINVSSEMLLGQLRPKYFVQIEERIYLADESDEGHDVIVPDIRIREVPASTFLGTSPAARGGLAVAPGIEVDAAWSLEVHEGRLAVIDRDLRRVVTIIEFLSPANKVKGSVGKQSYDEKKREILASDTNLVEIDLLRAGKPLYARSGFRPYDYIVQVWRRGDGRHRRFIWPALLKERLPVVPIPVRAGDEDAALDLQAVVNTAYDRAGYDLRIDYTTEARPPLQGDIAVWARELIAKPNGVAG